MFSCRIVTTDHYQARPIRGLDVVQSDFRNAPVHLVPILRLYGVTPRGQKTCMHIHGVFPYMYVPYDGRSDSQRYMRQFAASVDMALNVAMGKPTATTQYVFKISLVSGLPFYGYYAEEMPFMKIYLYSPSMVKKVADLLCGGAIMNRVYQPYEAHIPYHLQIFIDYNLYGMNMINVAAVKFRRREHDEDGAVPLRRHSSSLSACFDDSTSENNQSISPSSFLWNNENIAPDLWLDKEVQRQSTCELEVDVVAADILNRLEVGDNVGSNPGLTALWEDERQRRRERGSSQDIAPPDSPDRGDVRWSDAEMELQERLVEILEGLKPYTGEDESPASSQGVAATPSSSVDLHMSQQDEDSERISESSQDTVILDEEQNEEEKVIVNARSILQVVASSQSFRQEREQLQQTKGQEQRGEAKGNLESTQDLDVAAMLASLAEDTQDDDKGITEDQLASSQKLLSQLSERAEQLAEQDSILSQVSDAEPVKPQDIVNITGEEKDQNAIGEDEDVETLEMSQQIWESPEDLEEGETTEKESDEKSLRSEEVDVNLVGLNCSWNSSQLVDVPPQAARTPFGKTAYGSDIKETESDAESDISDVLPQFDGPGDDKPAAVPLKKTLGMRGTVMSPTGNKAAAEEHEDNSPAHEPNFSESKEFKSDTGKAEEEDKEETIKEHLTNQEKTEPDIEPPAEDAPNSVRSPKDPSDSVKSPEPFQSQESHDSSATRPRSSRASKAKCVAFLKDVTTSKHFQLDQYKKFPDSISQSKHLHSSPSASEKELSRSKSPVATDTSPKGSAKVKDDAEDVEKIKTRVKSPPGRQKKNVTEKSDNTSPVKKQSPRNKSPKANKMKLKMHFPKSGTKPDKGTAQPSVSSKEAESGKQKVAPAKPGRRPRKSENKVTGEYKKTRPSKVQQSEVKETKGNTAEPGSSGNEEQSTAESEKEVDENDKDHSDNFNDDNEDHVMSSPLIVRRRGSSDSSGGEHSYDEGENEELKSPTSDKSIGLSKRTEQIYDDLLSRGTPTVVVRKLSPRPGERTPTRDLSPISTGSHSPRSPRTVRKTPPSSRQKRAEARKSMSPHRYTKADAKKPSSLKQGDLSKEKSATKLISNTEAATLEQSVLHQGDKSKDTPVVSTDTAHIPQKSPPIQPPHLSDISDDEIDPQTKSDQLNAAKRQIELTESISKLSTAKINEDNSVPQLDDNAKKVENTTNETETKGQTEDTSHVENTDNSNTNSESQRTVNKSSGDVSNPDDDHISANPGSTPPDKDCKETTDITLTSGQAIEQTSPPETGQIQSESMDVSVKEPTDLMDPTQTESGPPELDVCETHTEKVALPETVPEPLISNENPNVSVSDSECPVLERMEVESNIEAESSKQNRVIKSRDSSSSQLSQALETAYENTSGKQYENTAEQSLPESALDDHTGCDDIIPTFDLSGAVFQGTKPRCPRKEKKSSKGLSPVVKHVPPKLKLSFAERRAQFVKKGKRFIQDQEVVQRVKAEKLRIRNIRKPEETVCFPYENTKQYVNSRSTKSGKNSSPVSCEGSVRISKTDCREFDLRQVCSESLVVPFLTVAEIVEMKEQVKLEVAHKRKEVQARQLQLAKPLTVPSKTYKDTPFGYYTSDAMSFNCDDEEVNEGMEGMIENPSQTDETSLEEPHNGQPEDGNSVQGEGTANSRQTMKRKKRRRGVSQAVRDKREQLQKQKEDTVVTNISQEEETQIEEKPEAHTEENFKVQIEEEKTVTQSEEKPEESTSIKRRRKKFRTESEKLKDDSTIKLCDDSPSQRRAVRSRTGKNATEAERSTEPSEDGEQDEVEKEEELSEPDVVTDDSDKDESFKPPTKVVKKRSEHWGYKRISTTHPTLVIEKPQKRSQKKERPPKAERPQKAVKERIPKPPKLKMERYIRPSGSFEANHSPELEEGLSRYHHAGFAPMLKTNMVTHSEVDLSEIGLCSFTTTSGKVVQHFFRMPTTSPARFRQMNKQYKQTRQQRKEETSEEEEEEDVENERGSDEEPKSRRHKKTSKSSTCIDLRGFSSFTAAPVFKQVAVEEVPEEEPVPQIKCYAIKRREKAPVVEKRAPSPVESEELTSTEIQQPIDSSEGEEPPVLIPEEVEQQSSAVSENEAKTTGCTVVQQPETPEEASETPEESPEPPEETPKRLHKTTKIQQQPHAKQQTRKASLQGQTIVVYADVPKVQQPETPEESSDSPVESPEPQKRLQNTTKIQQQPHAKQVAKDSRKDSLQGQTIVVYADVPKKKKESKKARAEKERDPSKPKIVSFDFEEEEFDVPEVGVPKSVNDPRMRAQEMKQAREERKSKEFSELFGDGDVTRITISNCTPVSGPVRRGNVGRAAMNQTQENDTDTATETIHTEEGEDEYDEANASNREGNDDGVVENKNANEKGLEMTNENAGTTEDQTETIIEKEEVDKEASILSAVEQAVDTTPESCEEGSVDERGEPLPTTPESCEEGSVDERGEPLPTTPESCEEGSVDERGEPLPTSPESCEEGSVDERGEPLPTSPESCEEGSIDERGEPLPTSDNKEPSNENLPEGDSAELISEDTQCKESATVIASHKTDDDDDTRSSRKRIIAKDPERAEKTSERVSKRRKVGDEKRKKEIYIKSNKTEGIESNSDMSENKTDKKANAETKADENLLSATSKARQTPVNDNKDTEITEKLNEAKQDVPARGPLKGEVDEVDFSVLENWMDTDEAQSEQHTQQIDNAGTSMLDTHEQLHTPPLLLENETNMEQNLRETRSLAEENKGLTSHTVDKDRKTNQQKLILLKPTTKSDANTREVSEDKTLMELAEKECDNTGAFSNQETMASKLSPNETVVEIRTTKSVKIRLAPNDCDNIKAHSSATVYHDVGHFAMPSVGTNIDSVLPKDPRRANKLGKAGLYSRKAGIFLEQTDSSESDISDKGPLQVDLNPESTNSSLNKIEDESSSEKITEASSGHSEISSVRLSPQSIENKHNRDKGSEKSPKADSSKEHTPKDNRNKEHSPIKDRVKEQSPKDDRIKERSPNSDYSKENCSKRDTSKVRSPKKDTSKGASPKKDISKEGSPKKHSSTEDSPKTDVSKLNSSKYDSAKDGSHKQTSYKHSGDKYSCQSERDRDRAGSKSDSCSAKSRSPESYRSKHSEKHRSSSERSDKHSEISHKHSGSSDKYSGSSHRYSDTSSHRHSDSYHRYSDRKSSDKDRSHREKGHRYSDRGSPGRHEKHSEEGKYKHRTSPSTSSTSHSSETKSHESRSHSPKHTGDRDVKRVSEHVSRKREPPSPSEDVTSGPTAAKHAKTSEPSNSKHEHHTSTEAKHTDSDLSLISQNNSNNRSLVDDSISQVPESPELLRAVSEDDHSIIELNTTPIEMEDIEGCSQLDGSGHCDEDSNGVGSPSKGGGDSPKKRRKYPKRMDSAFCKPSGVRARKSTQNRKFRDSLSLLHKKTLDNLSEGSPCSSEQSNEQVVSFSEVVSRHQRQMEDSDDREEVFTANVSIMNDSEEIQKDVLDKFGYLSPAADLEPSPESPPCPLSPTFHKIVDTSELYGIKDKPLAAFDHKKLSSSTYVLEKFENNPLSGSKTNEGSIDMPVLQKHSNKDNVSQIPSIESRDSRDYHTKAESEIESPSFPPELHIETPQSPPYISTSDTVATFREIPMVPEELLPTKSDHVVTEIPSTPVSDKQDRSAVRGSIDSTLTLSDLQHNSFSTGVSLECPASPPTSPPRSPSPAPPRSPSPINMPHKPSSVVRQVPVEIPLNIDDVVASDDSEIHERLSRRDTYVKGSSMHMRQHGEGSGKDSERRDGKSIEQSTSQRYHGRNKSSDRTRNDVPHSSHDSQPFNTQGSNRKPEELSDERQCVITPLQTPPGRSRIRQEAITLAITNEPEAFCSNPQDAKTKPR